MAGYDDSMPEACADWLHRWFGPVIAGQIGARFAPWNAETSLRFSYLVVDIAARDFVPAVFDLVGLDEEGGDLRSLPPISDPRSALRALPLLAPDTRPGLDHPHFLSSTKRVLEDTVAADEDYRKTGELDESWLEGIFGAAGALDMSMGRARSFLQDRLDIPALYRSALLARSPER